MAAQRSKRPARKPIRPRTGPQSLTRLGLALPLTPREARELKTRAAADLRTISNYVSHLVAEELERKRRRRRTLAGANPGEKLRPSAIRGLLDGGDRVVGGIVVTSGLRKGTHLTWVELAPARSRSCALPTARRSRGPTRPQPTRRRRD